MFASSPLNPWWWLLLPLQHSPKGQLAAFTSPAAAVRNISSVHLPPVFGRGEFEKFRGVHVHLHMVTCLLLEKEEEEDMWHHWKLWLWLWSVGEAAWPVEWHQKCKQTAHMVTFSDAKVYSHRINESSTYEVFLYRWGRIRDLLAFFHYPSVGWRLVMHFFRLDGSLLMEPL